MGRKKKVKIKKRINKILDLELERDGGRIALQGYTMQLLLSCLELLNISNENDYIKLESIEDIDLIKFEDEKIVKTVHIQVKTSKNKQDASFLKSIIKNFVEVYLINDERDFLLAYDFDVADGNLKKWVEGKLDAESLKYWETIVIGIKKENSNYCWEKFDFNDFFSKIDFQKINRMELENQIIKMVQTKFGIVEDNLSLYINAIKMMCLESMQTRNILKFENLKKLIELVKFDITKGQYNPAHSWLSIIEYKNIKGESDSSFFEGKKATPLDVVNKLPVRRDTIESDVAKSLKNNIVTVIKSSSGQGKTTIAYQVAFILSNEYKIYSLNWCADISENKNIVDIFKARIRLGEKILVLIDNLNERQKEWVNLIELIQLDTYDQVKVLITVREEDWFNYKGDISQIRKIRIINLTLEENEAKRIFSNLKERCLLHKNVVYWKTEWNKVSSSGLLIEYIYLLTHGEMLSDRIGAQLQEITKSNDSEIKLQMLKIISLADMCEVAIPLNKLIDYFKVDKTVNFNYILKSMNQEFLINYNSDQNWIRGLHPIRSQHIFDFLHEFDIKEDTAISVIQSIDKDSLPKLFMYLPDYIYINENFVTESIEVVWNVHNLDAVLNILKGSFSNMVSKYYKQNVEKFDIAQEHAGLPLIVSDCNPFRKFEEINESIETLEKLREIDPDNKNINFLIELRDSMEEIELEKTDFTIFCQIIRNKFEQYKPVIDIRDLNTFSSILKWLENTGNAYTIINGLDISLIWENKKNIRFDRLGLIFSLVNKVSRDNYEKFINANWQSIIDYFLSEAKLTSLKFKTDDPTDVKLEYLSLPSDQLVENDESVWRLRRLIEFFPNYETYSAQAIKPNIDFLEPYNIHDDSVKHMPKRSLIIMQHQEFARLWEDSILKHYEADTVNSWVDFWIKARVGTVKYFKIFQKCIYEKIKKGNFSAALGSEVDEIINKVNVMLCAPRYYPSQYLPFENRPDELKKFKEIETNYFSSIRNLLIQSVDLLMKDEKKSKLYMFNLYNVTYYYDQMKWFFSELCEKYYYKVDDNKKLLENERQSINELIMTCEYYLHNDGERRISSFELSKWYNLYIKKLIDNTTELFDDIQIYCPIYPEQIFYTKTLIEYILILDITGYDQEKALENIFFKTHRFAYSQFDYLVLFFMGEDKRIKRQGLKISKSFYEQILRDTDNSNFVLGPIPLEVNKDYLKVFDRELEIEKEIISKYKGFERLGEYLWEISLYNHTEEISEKDLNMRKEEGKQKAVELLDEYKGIIPEDLHEEYVDLLDKVFNGNNFSNSDYNQFLQEIINLSL